MGAEMLAAAKDYVTQGDAARWDHLADGLVCLHVTHSNLTRRMIEIRFDKHMTIADLKHKLHTHTGTPAFSQRLVLKDGGHPVANMDDDSKMLGYYSPESGMEIHVVDTDPFSMSRGGGLEDESQIAKYRMSDEAYESRRGTVRCHFFRCFYCLFLFFLTTLCWAFCLGPAVLIILRRRRLIIGAPLGHSHCS